MKFCVVFVVLIAAAFAEHCRDKSECDMNNCASGNHPECVHHVCTCDSNMMQSTTAKPMTMCLSRDDCSKDTQPGCMSHCVDGVCRCLHI